MPYRSPFQMRDRLAALMQSDALVSVSFPHPIKKYDPYTVDQATDADLCLVVSGQNTDQGALGPRGAGRLEITGQITLLVYVYSGAIDQAAFDRCGALTMQALEALFHYEVDPTPGDGLWYLMQLAGTPLQTTYETTATFHLSRTPVNLRSRQTKS